MTAVAAGLSFLAIAGEIAAEKSPGPARCSFICSMRFISSMRPRFNAG